MIKHLGPGAASARCAKGFCCFANLLCTAGTCGTAEDDLCSKTVLSHQSGLLLWHM
jgi:hypothetical protein